MGYPIQAIHVPKTVDNDLPITDVSPGFGSVAKYTAVCAREAGMDVASMCATSTKVFVMEVMGRHAGWIAAAAGLAQEEAGDPPHIILFPEIAFDKAKFLKKVQQTVNKVGYCVVAVSEGARYKDGTFLADAGSVDAFGHKQLGGVAPVIAQMVKDELGHKYHWSVADYLQRSARHIASKVDVEQAYAVGKAAVEMAVAGKNSVMPAIVRGKGKRYSWSIGEAPLAKVANVEKKMPRSYITRDGFGITQAGRDYLAPLIGGEDYPPYKNGLPQYARPKLVAVEKKLKTFKL
jgi:6-phosphofructokinase 1